MRTSRQTYIAGQWLDPADEQSIEVIDPATARPYARLGIGGTAEVDRAVAAAKQAFDAYARWPVDARVALLSRVLDIYRRRYDEVAQTISQEMGAPIAFARAMQAAVGTAHLEQTIRALQSFRFATQTDSLLVSHEPIGVCALITPWNWPINQIVCKVAPALAAGCTMVLKPSEIAPLSAILFAEILDEAGVPPGVFNLVHGYGHVVGDALARHPDVDMVSFTGSTRAGIEVAKAAADTVKRVHQELGSKSPNLILPTRTLPTQSRAAYAAASVTAASRAMHRRGCWCTSIGWPKPKRPRATRRAARSSAIRVRPRRRSGRS